MSHCETCGTRIQSRTSAYEPWEEEYRLIHTQAPPEDVDFSDGVLDVTETNHYCSDECLFEDLCGSEEEEEEETEDEEESAWEEEALKSGKLIGGDGEVIREEGDTTHEFINAVRDGEVEEAFTVDEVNEVVPEIDDPNLLKDARRIDGRKTSEAIYGDRLEELEE